jgi:creatinine amidohydrolase
VKKDRLADVLPTPNAAPGTWSATPAPSPIGLYKPGEGAPRDFDQKKADEYFRRVNACVGRLVKETLRQWSAAGFN